MPEPKSDFLKAVVERGFLYQCTDLEALDDLCARESVTAYVGYDCTASSLHVGSMVSIMLLRLFQKAGHKPIILMGGGTTMIGDPSGKDTGRRMLNEAEIAKNMAGIKDCFAKYLSFGDGPADAVMVNNADWLGELQYIHFLREFGPHFSVNRMLTFESVKSRLDREQPLSFLEFNYMVLQAYDFLELSRTRNCLLQMGGSDQWGNIINGVELARRVDSRTLYGLSVPLITTVDGAKMGKSAGGAVWVNADMLTPYDFWQFWRNTSDPDVGRFLRLFTELPLDEIARLEDLSGQEINDAKIILANEVTTLCHGGAAAAAAAKTAAETFYQGGAGEGLPTIEVAHADLAAGVPLVDLLVQAGLAASKGEAKRLIKGKGARLNGETITEENQSVTASDLGSDGAIKLSAGKKRHALVKARN